MRGRHLIKCWAKAQHVVSLSSAEAELYSAVKAASEMIGIKSVMGDMGMSCSMVLAVDASAAIGMMNRTGLGKAKHIETQFMWVQEKIKHGTFELVKVGTAKNPADIFTKQLAERAMIEHLGRMGVSCPYGDTWGATCKQMSSTGTEERLS